MSPFHKSVVVTPTYNEVDNIEALLRGIMENAPQADVLFVDDNSSDGTADLIRAHCARRPEKIHLIQRPRKMGLGTAYVAGFRWALVRRYDLIIEMDADLSHDPRDLPRMLDFPAGVQAVIGSRYIPGGNTKNWNLSRRSISRFGNFYARTILRLPIRDLTGGFNAWSREVLESVDLTAIRSEGYAFQVELKLRATQAGFSLYEIPIIFVDRRVGQSKMSWSVALEAMLMVWVLRLRRRA